MTTGLAYQSLREGTEEERQLQVTLVFSHVEFSCVQGAFLWTQVGITGNKETQQVCSLEAEVKEPGIQAGWGRK